MPSGFENPTDVCGSRRVHHFPLSKQRLNYSCKEKDSCFQIEPLCLQTAIKPSILLPQPPAG